MIFGGTNSQQSLPCLASYHQGGENPLWLWSMTNIPRITLLVGTEEYTDRREECSTAPWSNSTTATMTNGSLKEFIQNQYISLSMTKRNEKCRLYSILDKDMGGDNSWSSRMSIPIARRVRNWRRNSRMRRTRCRHGG